MHSPKHLTDKWALEQNRVCLRRDEGNCAGRITKEHAMIFAGKQIQEDWACLDICEYHHSVGRFQDGGAMNKEKHEWIALNRADDATLKKYSKAVDLLHKRNYLNTIYGVYRNNNKG